MKRLWIGVGLLVGIVLVGMWTTGKLNRIHIAIAEELLQSAQAAQAGNWVDADAAAENAAQGWQESWHFSAALADHTVLDEIDGLFAQAEIYRKNRSTVDYAAVCARLAQHVQALQEGHRISWWNLL